MARYALAIGVSRYDNFRNLDKAATDAVAIASQFLFTSLHLYHELDLTEKGIKVSQ